MSLQGKGFWTYILSECQGGNPAAIVSAAQAAGLSHVLVKIADGTSAFGMSGGNDITAPVVLALRKAGIAVWGWHYVYGGDPTGEANIGISRALSLGVDGYIVDAEEEYKFKESQARTYMNLVRGALDVPIALSSFRFPQYHPELPWATFLEKCDYHMPQVYWEQAHNVDWQLRESKRQCDALPNARPYIPTGPAYGTPPIWDPTPEDILQFLNTARDLGLPAVNFFQWDYCRAKLPALWDAIASFSWPAPPQTIPPLDGSGTDETGDHGGTPPSGADPVQPASPTTQDAVANQFLAALNSRQASQVVALYTPNATAIHAGTPLSGTAAIQSGYASFLASIPAGTSFAYTRVGIQGVTRYLNWKAGELKGLTTLIVAQNKISLSFTNITPPPVG